MNEKELGSWENFLDPAVLRQNLIIASLYITAFQLLKEAIVDQLRNFYAIGFDERGLQIDPMYDTKVLARGSSPVYSSLDWLRESGAIDSNDMEVFTSVKNLRNMLAHDLTQILCKGLPPDLPARFNEIVSLLTKIDRWWIMQVEIPTIPDYVGKEVDVRDVLPGRILGLQLLMDVAIGTESESTKHLVEFRKRRNQSD